MLGSCCWASRGSVPAGLIFRYLFEAVKKQCTAVNDVDVSLLLKQAFCLQFSHAELMALLSAVSGQWDDVSVCSARGLHPCAMAQPAAVLLIAFCPL